MIAPLLSFVGTLDGLGFGRRGPVIGLSVSRLCRNYEHTYLPSTYLLTYLPTYLPTWDSGLEGGAGDRALSESALPQLRTFVFGLNLDYLFHNIHQLQIVGNISFGLFLLLLVLRVFLQFMLG